MEYRIKDAGGDPRKRWYVDYFLNGQRKRKWLPTTLKTTERYRYARKWIADHKAQTRAQSEQKQVSKRGEIAHRLNLYLNQRLQSIENTTYTTYRCYLRRFMDWARKQGHMGNLNTDPDLFTTDHARDFLNYILSLGLSRKTHNASKWFLSGLWKRLLMDGWADVNPWAGIPDLRVGIPKKTLPDADTYRYYLQKLKMYSPGLFTMATIIRALLCRPGKELRLLKVRDVNLDDQYLYIDATASKNDDAAKPIIPKAILPELRYIKKYPPGFYVFGNNKMMLPDERPVHRTTLFNRHQALMKDIGLDGMTLYKNKHYGAYLMAQSGISVMGIQKQARHRNIQSTMHYLETILVDRALFDQINNAQLGVDL